MLQATTTSALCVSHHHHPNIVNNNTRHMKPTAAAAAAAAGGAGASKRSSSLSSSLSSENCCQPSSSSSSSHEQSSVSATHTQLKRARMSSPWHTCVCLSVCVKEMHSFKRWNCLYSSPLLFTTQLLKLSLADTTSFHWLTHGTQHRHAVDVMTTRDIHRSQQLTLDLLTLTQCSV